jgi:hypothetical protein
MGLEAPFGSMGCIVIEGERIKSIGKKASCRFRKAAAHQRHWQNDPTGIYRRSRTL